MATRHNATHTSTRYHGSRVIWSGQLPDEETTALVPWMLLSAGLPACRSTSSFNGEVCSEATDCTADGKDGGLGDSNVIGTGIGIGSGRGTGSGSSELLGNGGGSGMLGGCCGGGAEGAGACGGNGGDLHSKRLPWERP